jgi:type IV pilus assembly protein PilV
MNRQQGFTLLEVLVAIVILAIGLIGLAGLQVVSTKNNQTAYYRAIAIQQVYDMADRMRANLAGVRAGDYNDMTGLADSGCVVASCSAQEVANTDKFQWNANNSVLLPQGAGAIACAGTCPPATGDWVFNITVSWHERGEGATAGATHSIVESMRP